jgi:hypothetical protein
MAVEIVGRCREEDTPVGIVRNASRQGEEVRITTLAGLNKHYESIDMSTIVVVGNSTTYVAGGRMITPRGYREAGRGVIERLSPWRRTLIFELQLQGFGCLTNGIITTLRRRDSLVVADDIAGASNIKSYKGIPICADVLYKMARGVGIGGESSSHIPQ